MNTSNKNTRVVIALVAMVGVMIGLVAASEPLYRMFCNATGFGGTTRRAVAASPTISSREVTVSFDGNVDSALPWDFGPEVRNIKVRLGQTVTVKYRAHNRSHAATTGTATFNVQPDKAGPYFDKIQCFCFTEQALKPGETVELPVQFYIDPAMADDPEDGDVQNITLSYTFFSAKDKNKTKPPG